MEVRGDRLLHMAGHHLFSTPIGVAGRRRRNIASIWVIVSFKRINLTLVALQTRLVLPLSETEQTQIQYGERPWGSSMRVAVARTEFPSQNFVQISAFAMLSVYVQAGEKMTLQIKIDEIQTYN
jgi:hypothetical protein